MPRTSKHYRRSEENTSVSPRRDVLRVSGDFGISIWIYLPGILSSAFVVVRRTGKTSHDPSRLVPCNFTRSRRGLFQSDASRLKRQYTNLTTKTIVVCVVLCVCVCCFFYSNRFLLKRPCYLYFLFFTLTNRPRPIKSCPYLGISSVSSSTLRKFHPVYLISKKVKNRRQ